MRPSRSWGESRPVGRHEVAGGDGANGHYVGVGATIAHHADALQGGQHGEGLAQLAIETGAANLFDDDGIGGAQGCQSLLVYGADDADGQAGAGEGMPPDPIFGQAKCQADLAHLVFEEHAQRLDQLEGHVFRQTAHVVVRLDARRGRGGIVAGAFDHVGIERSLRQEGDGADLLSPAATPPPRRRE